jgi:hypothetical protein
MAYVFYPPRTANYFPPGMPYLAGLRGLGDYATDYAAYKHAASLYELDYKKWVLERAKYNAALAAYNTKVANLTAAYGTDMAAYNRDKADWDKEYAAYQLAMQSWLTNFANYKRDNVTRAQAIAKAYGLTLSQVFYDNGACLTQAEHDAYARSCTTVRGLGYLRGLGSSDPDCGWKAMPVCQFGPQPTLRAQPTLPSAPVYPKKPTLRPVPVAPLAPTPPSGGSQTTTPASVSLPSPGPDSSLTPAAPDEPKQANVLMGGLIVAAVLGGGYLVYRTLRKPKAQAA